MVNDSCCPDSASPSLLNFRPRSLVKPHAWRRVGSCIPCWLFLGIIAWIILRAVKARPSVLLASWRISRVLAISRTDYECNDSEPILFEQTHDAVRLLLAVSWVDRYFTVITK